MSLGYFYLVSSNTSDELYVLAPKLETGTLATDWTPAPEDMDASIATVQADLTTYKSAQATKDDAQTSEINSAKSQINTNKSAIDSMRTTKADKNEVATLARTTLQSEWQTAATNAANIAQSAAATDAQAKADAAKNAAITASATAAQAKADAAKAQAIASASTDAQAKADAAKAQAIADATAKDAVIKQQAATDAQARADAAKNAAIADATAKINATNAKVSTLEQTVSNNDSATASRFTTVEASISKLKTDVTADITAKIDAERIARVNADNAQTAETNALKTRVGNAESGITSLRQTVANNQQAEATAREQLSARVDNISVGGRNLLTGTANMLLGNGVWHTRTFRKSGSGNIESVSVSDSPVVGVSKAIKITGSTSESGFAQDVRPVQAGWFTASAWVKGSAGLKVRLQPFWSQNNQSVPSKTFTLNSSDWVKLEFCAENKVAGPMSLGYFYLVSANTSDMLYVLAPKMETGTLATDWTPAPEDTDASIATVQAELTAHKSAQATRDDAQTAEINIAKSQIEGHTAQISNLQTTKANQSEVVATARSGLRSEWEMTALNLAVGAEFRAKTAAAADTQAKADVVQADLNTLKTTVANEKTATAAQINSLNSKLGTAEANIRTAQTATATLDGKVQALHTVKVETVAGGKKVMAGLALGADGATGESQINVHAQKFAVWDGAMLKPVFAIVTQNGKTMTAISGDLIADGTILGKHLAASQTINAPTISGGTISGGLITGTTIRGARLEAVDLEATNIVGDVINAKSFAFDVSAKEFICQIPESRKSKRTLVLPQVYAVAEEGWTVRLDLRFDGEIVKQKEFRAQSKSTYVEKDVRDTFWTGGTTVGGFVNGSYISGNLPSEMHSIDFKVDFNIPYAIPKMSNISYLREIDGRAHTLTLISHINNERNEEPLGDTSGLVCFII